MPPRHPAAGRRAPLPRDKRRADHGHLRSLAMNALGLDDFWSITDGLAALDHDIPGLLALLGWRKPAQVLNPA